MTTTVLIKNNGPGAVRTWTQQLDADGNVVGIFCGQLEPGEEFTAVCYRNQRFLIEENAP